MNRALLLQAQRRFTAPCDPDQPDLPARVRHADELIERCAIAIFIADARDSFVKIDPQTQRPETKDAAFHRRWRELPEKRRDDYRRLAIACRQAERMN